MILKKLTSKQNLLAVSKLQPANKIRSLYGEGQRDFAENYIQEALTKSEQLADLEIRWHLIGPIQKNKIKHLKKNFAYIHSVDSLALAEKISQYATAQGFVQKCFIQLNLSGEKTKSGFTQLEFETSWPVLSQLRGLEVVGLMTMPPLENEPEKNRAFFRELKYIGDKFNLQQFSMGTSHDFHIALEEGATWIRIGTMLFGERKQKRGQL